MGDRRIAVKIGHHDRVARGGEALARRPSDAAGAAGHQCHAASHGRAPARSRR